ncbi:MAG: NAD-dependent epimerase/dehydratase family protein [Halieaceae bacterium]|jgi:dihydroflavonol-4-reductase|nr:NAD-dependent epimerase/dehydratase family protein [Halieaceae bacterium]
MSKKLVVGASGFLGSHVTKALVAAGQDVRVLVRPTSNTESIDHLKLELVHGNVLDSTSLEKAMNGCESVYYCVVDTRAWLQDPTPLYRVNVDGLRNTMDAFLARGAGKFMFTSTFGTLGRRCDGPSTEADAFNWWEDAPEYIRCRVVAENLFMEYCRDKGLPGVACCVGNTYGPGDVGPTPHGNLVRLAAQGRLPVFWDGGGPSLGIEDAARGMILAEQRGRIGERYVFAQRWVSFKELLTLAATSGGRRPPWIRVPIPVLDGIAKITERVCRFLNLESVVTASSIKCARMLPNVKCEKAERELEWIPSPVEQSVHKAVDYYLNRMPL